MEDLYSYLAKFSPPLTPVQVQEISKKAEEIVREKVTEEAKQQQEAALRV